MNQEYLNHLHKEMLIIYKEIERICLKHDLKFFAVGGTLIGAVVWKDYIPWDDDLDIAMPREDYEKFIHICQYEISDRFFLHHISTDENYWLPFAKLRLVNTDFIEEKRKNIKEHTGIYVDIFPFDYAPSNEIDIQQIIKWKLINYINNYINGKVTCNLKKSRNGLFLNPVFSLFSIKQLSNFRDKIYLSFDKGERLFFLDSAGGRSLENSFFSIKKILPTQKLKFGDIEIITPFDSDYYLTMLYTKKYLEIPPKEKQITHNPVYVKFEDGTEYIFKESETR